MEHLEAVENSVINVSFNRTTNLLFYIAKSLKMDMAILYFLYKKYGEDVLYFFFMLCGNKISIPKEDRFLLLIKNADDIFDKVTKNPGREINKVKDKEIYDDLISSLNSYTMEIQI
jgi:hypothetical protein